MQIWLQSLGFSLPKFGFSSLCLCKLKLHVPCTLITLAAAFITLAAEAFLHAPPEAAASFFFQCCSSQPLFFPHNPQQFPQLTSFPSLSPSPLPISSSIFSHASQPPPPHVDSASSVSAASSPSPALCLPFQPLTVSSLSPSLITPATSLQQPQPHPSSASIFPCPRQLGHHLCCHRRCLATRPVHLSGFAVNVHRVSTPLPSVQPQLAMHSFPVSFCRRPLPAVLILFNSRLLVIDGLHFVGPALGWQLVGLFLSALQFIWLLFD